MSDGHGPVPPSDPPGGIAVGGAQYPAGPPDGGRPGCPPARPAGAAGPTDPGPAPVASARRRAGLVAIGAAVVLLVVAGVVALATGDRRGRRGGPSTSSTAPDTTDRFSSPQDPVAPVPPPRPRPVGPRLRPVRPPRAPREARPLAEVLPELIDFVEVTRGHRFRTEPVVEAVDEATFLERFRAGVEGTEEDVRDAGVAQRALGILEPDDDPVAIQDDLGEQGVLGFYDPESKELVVRGDQVTPYVETIIVHELTHALDDQYFDLQRVEAPGRAARRVRLRVPGPHRGLGPAGAGRLRGAAQPRRPDLGPDRVPHLRVRRALGPDRRPAAPPVRGGDPAALRQRRRPGPGHRRPGRQRGPRRRLRVAARPPASRCSTRRSTWRGTPPSPSPCPPPTAPSSPRAPSAPSTCGSWRWRPTRSRPRPCSTSPVRCRPRCRSTRWRASPGAAT